MKKVAEEGLVGELVARDRGVGGHALEDEVVEGFRWVDDLEAAVGFERGKGRRVGL